MKTTKRCKVKNTRLYILKKISVMKTIRYQLMPLRLVDIQNVIRLPKKQVQAKLRQLNTSIMCQ